MIPYFSFENKKSTDFGLIVKGERTIGAASPGVEFIEIPGLSGDLISSNKRYKNYEDNYDCALLPTDNVENAAHKIKAWLQSAVTYGRLIDYNEPYYYRKAVCVNSIEIAKTLSIIGMCTITFNCKPQYYRLDGDTVKSFTAAGTLSNPEPFESLPYIKVTGTGDITLHINDQNIILTDISDYVEIDAELKSCYRGTELLNTHYRSNFWPVLRPGNNSISWTGNVTKVEIKPRWWTL